MPITWETPPGVEITGNVRISLSSDGGKTFDIMIAETENTGSHLWDPVTDPVTGDEEDYYYNCVLKIEPIGGDSSKGTTQGLFTIRTNSPPDVPSYLSPDNGATGLSVDETDILWEPSNDPDGDTVTYDVYLGTSDTLATPVAENLTMTTYDPGTLSCNATYYWKVVACDNHETCTEGPLWDFSTVVEPGDVNGDCAVDLTDALLALQVVCGIIPGEPIFPGADVNKDGIIGLAEVLYIVQVVSLFR
jgi:hypothetical protein